MANNDFSQANSMAAASAIMLQAVQEITGSNNHQQDGEKEPEQYSMNSNLFPCICVAMYETILSPQFFEENMNEGEEEFYYDTVDFDDWKKELTKVCQDYLDEHVTDGLRNYGLVGIEAEDIWSPKYYNYHQDELNMTVSMAEGWQEIMKEKIEAWRGRQDVQEYISENWRSYDGYMNFMPESLDELLEEDDVYRQLAGYLTLAMLVEGTLRPYGDILEDLYYSMDDFSDYDRVNVIEEYYDDIDEANKLLRLWNNDDDWNELYWSLREKIGSPWRRDSRYDHLDGIKDCGFSWQADSEGKRMLFWAVKQELTVQDLYDMAA